MRATFQSNRPLECRLRKENQNMKLKLQNPYHCQEGKWRGTCENIFEVKNTMDNGCDQCVRLRFVVDTDEGEKKVARTFRAELSVGGELHEFLNSWLGGDLEWLLDEDGQIDLDLLIGEKADLHIVHGRQDAQYRYPVVLIHKICPPGRLIKGRRPEEVLHHIFH